MPNLAEQAIQSDNFVQPTHDFSQSRYVHQQSLMDLLPKPGQPAHGLGQSDEPGADSLQTPMSRQREDQRLCKAKGRRGRQIYLGKVGPLWRVCPGFSSF